LQQDALQVRVSSDLAFQVQVSYGAMLSTFERTKQWQMALQMAGHASFVDSISWTSVMTGTTWQVPLLMGVCSEVWKDQGLAVGMGESGSWYL